MEVFLRLQKEIKFKITENEIYSFSLLLCIALISALKGKKKEELKKNQNADQNEVKILISEEISLDYVSKLIDILKNSNLTIS